jgi:hypothetical protein
LFCLVVPDADHPQTSSGPTGSCGRVPS